MILTASKDLAVFYDRLAQKIDDRKAGANWLIGPVKSHLRELGKDISQSAISTCQMAGLINLVSSKKISFSKASAEVLPCLFKDPHADAELVATELNLLHASDGGI